MLSAIITTTTLARLLRMGAVLMGMLIKVVKETIIIPQVALSINMRVIVTIMGTILPLEE
jgi:hypothetical protein